MRIIPDIVAIRCQILHCVIVAAKTCDVAVSLADDHLTSQVCLRVDDIDAACKILELCRSQGLLICDPKNGAPWSLSELAQRQPRKIRLYHRIIIGGRIIHGGMSGLDLMIEPGATPAVKVDFPDKRFSEAWVNIGLKNQTQFVDPSLLSRVSDTHRPTKVDIIFTWVDGADPNWQAKRAQYSPDRPTKDASDAARFLTNNELQYALRGLFRYFDGIGNVYLVTDQQTPDDWEEFADRVTLVDHSEIMDDDVLRPTFNSHAIESCLHKIPGLKDHYIYFNDDVILTSPVSIADFFDDQGRAVQFYSDKNVIPERTSDQSVAADFAAINAQKIISAHYGVRVTRKFKHCPIATKKEVVESLEVKFSDLFFNIRQNRFRHQDDIAPAGSFSQHIGLITDKATTGDIPYQYLDINGVKLPLHLMRLAGLSSFERPVVVCLNAVTGGVGSALNRCSIAWEMKRMLPPDYENKSILGEIHHGILRLRSRVLNVLRRSKD